jgi:zinc protease
MTERTIAVMPPPVPGAPPLPRVPVPERWTAECGVRVVAVPRATIPQVVLRLVLPAGASADPAPYPGCASLVGQLLTEGTAGYTADELNARLDGLGAALQASVGHDFAEVEAVLLSDTLDEGVTLLAEVVMRPAFPEAETERVRAESLEAIEARSDEYANVADDRASLEVFGAGHPYGRPPFGTAAGVAAVPREVLRDFHAARYLPGGGFLVAAGDFDPDVLRAALDDAFRGWTGTAEPIVYPAPAAAPAAAGRMLVTRREDAAQSEIRIAGVGLDRRAPDWVAGAVANYVLGGSTITGRLGANLREDKGWTYGVHSGFSAGIGRGGWIAETAVDVEVTADAVVEMVGELTRMVREPVGADELRRAKDALILSLPRVFETPAHVAGRFATLEAYDLPRDYWERYPAAVEAVTAGDVQRIARERWDPERLVRIVVGGLDGDDAPDGGTPAP